MRRALILVALTASYGGSLRAEEEAGRFRTAVSVVGGISVGSSRGFGLPGRGFGAALGGGGAAMAVGGGIARDISPRLTLEATGVYLDRGQSAWSADAGFRLNLVPSSKSMVPYFAASGGVYGQRSERLELDVRAQLTDTRNQQFNQPQGQRGGLPAAQPGRSDPRVPVVQAVVVERTSVRGDGERQTSGLLSLGGGVRFDAGSHVFVRPDVRAQLLFSGDTRVFGLFTLNFGYRF